MNTRTPSTRQGFTLIELLTVIAIIGILAAILIPAINGVITQAHKIAASSNAGQIAKSYINYENSSSNQRIISTTAQNPSGTLQTGTASKIEDVAFILALKTGLNDAHLWYINNDAALAGQPIPNSVISGDLQSATATDPTFTATTPKSWAFVIGLPASSAATTTPLVWTYNLQHDGTWAKASPWQGGGGHIAYLDGHVSWEDNMSAMSGQDGFVVNQSNPNPGTQTADYANAIPTATGKPAVPLNTTGTGGP